MVGHGVTFTNIHMPLGPNTTKRFSFVIHPLSVEYFKNVAPLDTVAKVAPSQLMRAVEKSMAHAPPNMPRTTPIIIPAA